MPFCASRSVSAVSLAEAKLCSDCAESRSAEASLTLARLLLAMSKRIADHLRDTNRKLLTLAQVSKALQQELDAVHSVNRRLVDQVAALEQRGARAAG